MAKQQLMKDGLSTPAINRIAQALSLTLPDFPTPRFVVDAERGIRALELKDRVRHLMGVLHNFLPDDFEKTAEILIRLKNNWNPGDPADPLRGFAAWPIIDYIGEYGLNHPNISLNALKELTSLFSAEFAIRPFFIKHTALTLKTTEDWCTNPNEDIRRLASEGSRPRLPWGPQLPAFIKDPTPLFNVLEKLKDDPSEYVRRSVANNLNDISKDHPEQVITLCKRWQKNASPERKWIIRHATRTLVKAGHPDVFGLLGHTASPKIGFQSLEVFPKRIKLGESIEFRVKLQSEHSKPQSIVIDYAIHHMKANGKTAPKVFKFRTVKIDPGETVEFSKRHAIKPITTRNYYPGKHAVEILINGKTFGEATFTLRLE